MIGLRNERMIEEKALIKRNEAEKGSNI